MVLADLKPCPFCGSAARLSAVMVGGYPRIAAGCVVVTCPGNPGSFAWDSEASKAANQWNTRKP